MAFPPRFLEELRARVSITDVVGRCVRLVRKGRGEATGLCPFHNEKTPSFTVSEDKGFFHCFGCGAHGDVIGFVMRSEGLEFPQAVERLAGEAGMQVPRETPEERERAERQATLGGAVEFAAKHFEQQLRASGGRPGLDYLKRRGLTDDTVRRFRLGFAQDSRHGLKAALEKAGIPEAIALEAGLLIKPEDGGHAYDRFRGRVMFPILDRRGQAIAFGGRILDQGEPKYLNSPETPLFHKGRVLYGLSHAQKTARETNEIIVVEGYMDVIALAQAGIGNAVAPLGTALTEDQIALLWRMAEEPILCFDGDSAGQRAAARAADRAVPLLRPGLSLRFAWMPAGEDPDSLVRAKGAAGFRDELERMEPLIDVLWRQILADRPLDTPERRAGFRRDLAEAVARIADKSVQDAYRQEIQQRLQAQWKPAPNFTPGRPPANTGAIAGSLRLASLGNVAVRDYQLILSAVINHPELAHRFCEDINEINFPRALDRLKGAIIDLAARAPDLDSLGFRNQLTDMGFAGDLGGLTARPLIEKFAHPSADVGIAGDGLARTIEGLRDRPAAVREFKDTARDLEAVMTDPNRSASAEMLMAKLKAAQAAVHEVEKRVFDPERPPRDQ
ncbi:MAG TPA: DNA primase [Dongiaceae bacterium]|nr:DNA primase [Dongiaceae bacterium]